MELRNYKYIAIDSNRKTIKGRMEALNRSVCIKFLKAKNYEIIKITEYRSIISKINNISFGKMITMKQIVFFLKQLGSLLNAGVNLLPALELLSLQQDKRVLRKLFFEIYQNVYNGFSFSKSLSNRPKEFPNLLIQMVEVGEISGELPDTVIRLADYYAKQMKMNSQIIGAIRTPIIYLSAALMIAMGMILFVFPNITGLFAAFGDAKLPGITLAFLAAGDFMTTYALPIFGSVTLFVILFIFLNKKVEKFHYGVTVFTLNFPILGTLVQMSNQVLIANSLSQMMGRGINSLKALQTTRNVISNVVFKDLITQTITYIEDGKPFSKSFEESKYIDPVMARMIATGEKSGDIPKLMDNLATYYNGITELRVEQLKNAIQPILLLFVYALVGVMIMALMLPMLSLGGQI